MSTQQISSVLPAQSPSIGNSISSPPSTLLKIPFSPTSTPASSDRKTKDSTNLIFNSLDERKAGTIIFSPQRRAESSTNHTIKFVRNNTSSPDLPIHIGTPDVRVDLNETQRCSKTCLCVIGLAMCIFTTGLIIASKYFVDSKP